MTKEKPKLDERFITRIEGREFVKYPGLLDLAHQKGLEQIEVVPLQFPTKENGNFAIIKATVTSKEGYSFSDIGDANPENVNSRVARHLLRMASTRAIARALRSFTNIGMTCLEELADINEVVEENSKTTRKSSTRKTTAKQNEEAKKTEPPKLVKPSTKPQTPASEPDKPKMSEAQKKAIYNLAQRRGIDPNSLDNMSREAFGVDLQFLTSSDASSFIRHLQQAA